jgi:hypothetical protein
MQTFKEYFNTDLEKTSGHVIESSDNITTMNEGLMKKAMPFIAAGLTGLGGMSHADVATNSISQPSNNLRVHKKSAYDIDREIKYNQYLDSLNKTKKQAPKVAPKATPPSVKSKQNVDNIRKLIPAIAKQETGGIAPNKRDRAIGDNGRALGRYQIHAEAVKDVNRIYKTNYTHKDMFDPVKAEDVLVKYLTFWGKFNKKHKGIEPSLKNLAAMWNGGGPSGFKNSKALNYAKSVLNHMYASN